MIINLTIQTSHQSPMIWLKVQTTDAQHTVPISVVSILSPKNNGWSIISTINLMVGSKIKDKRYEAMGKCVIVNGVAEASKGACTCYLMDTIG